MLTPINHAGYNLFHQGQIALAEIEANGMKIDVPYLDGKIQKTNAQVKQLTEELRTKKSCRKVYTVWRKRYGAKTNLGSRDQLSKILFDVLKVPYPATIPVNDVESDKKRRWRADKDVLEDVDLPFVRKFLKVEKLKKASSTYLTGIRREVDNNGFIHPIYNLNIPATYRSSVDSPPTQQIPIRDDDIASLIRPAFIPRHPNRQVAEKDFSGIEVKVSACYNKDPQLIRYIRDPKTDMHRDMSMECYMLKQAQVSKLIRSCVKGMFVFAEFYGDWYFSCAVRLWQAISRNNLQTEDGVPLKDHLRRKGIKSLGNLDSDAAPVPGTFIYHIKQVEQRFWKERFKVYDQWKWDWWNAYLEQGFFDTYTGFRCTAPMDKKQCTNFAIQGSAFHCLLWSLIQVQKRLHKYHMRTVLTGQIHDSLIADVAKGELKAYGEITDQVMTVDLPKHWRWIIVPIGAELEAAPAGKSWFEKEKVTF